MSHTQGPQGTDDEDSQTGATWEALRDGVPAVQGAVYASTLAGGANLEAAGVTRYVQSTRVSAHYFDVLGVKPIFGRGFTEAEDRVGGGNVAVVSYDLWRTALGGDPAALGRPITLKGEPYTLVGVLAPHAKTTTLSEVWTPIRPTTTGEGGGTNYGIVMRLRDGATWQQANAQLAQLKPAWIGRFEGGGGGRKAWLYAMPLQRLLGATIGTPLFLLMLAASFVLLIACANLAGLTLVRIARRNAEMATRLALGASRWRVLRQLWAESIMLALLGGAVALAVALLALRALQAMVPPDMLPIGGLGIDWRVLAFTLAASLATSVVFGGLPALHTRRVDIRAALAAGAQRTIARGSKFRPVMIAGEVALTVVLLVGAGLLVRTLAFLETQPPGFDATGVTTAKLSLDNARYHDEPAFSGLMTRSVAAMEKILGVESAAVGLSLPYERALNDGVEIADGKQAGKSDETGEIYITPNYFTVLRIPILAGRATLDSDTAESEPVTVVNATFAKRELGAIEPAEALGRHVKTEGKTYRVVGVAGNVMVTPGLEADAPLTPERMLYVPASQMNIKLVALAHVWFQPNWIVRTRGPVQGLSQQMQTALASVDTGLPFAGFFSMEQLRAHALLQQRIEVMLLGAIALLALLLSAIGVYSLISNMVVQRTREIGIRIALGSTISQAMLSIGRSGVTAASAGLAVGVILALLGARVLRSVLFGIGAYDFVSFAGSILLLAVVALSAAFLPTLRVAKIDPAETLRSE
jgi:predicted permease